jgi:hypothetical protein
VQAAIARRKLHVPDNLFEHEFFGASAPADPDRWVFHYTSLASAQLIASNGTLRFGRMRTMNDPREYKAVEPFTVTAGPGHGLTTQEVRHAIEALVATRLEMAVASFTADAASGNDATATRAAARGYARPSMWAHYADRHRGVCLVLERDALERQVRSLYGSECVAGRVEYVAGIDPMDWSSYLSLDDVATRGEAQAVEDHVRGNLQGLVFTKNSDWEAEREWRCCIVREPSGNPIFVPLTSTIVTGVVVGLDFAESDLSHLRNFANRFDIASTVARTYIHQLNMLDVLPIDTSTSRWRYYTQPELRGLGYLYDG